MMKKRICLVATMCLVFSCVSPVCANNHTDSALPTDFISYSTSTDTVSRLKQDASYHYIKNTSGMVLCVKSLSPLGNVNFTNRNLAKVLPGEYFISNYVYEQGYTQCKLRISTAKSTVSGHLSGKWSPDSVGSCPVANP